MKHILLTLAGILYSFLLLAQSTDSFNYQTVVRSGDGELIANQEINFRFQIVEGTADGLSVYSETQVVTTNEHGVCNIKIGAGSDASGDIGSLNWGENAYFLNVAIDITGATSFKDIGTVELISVPYAFYSKKAENSENSEYAVNAENSQEANHALNSENAVYSDTAEVAKRLDEEVLYFTNTDTLFAVKDREGNIVFAVFPDGAKVYVNEGVKGRVGGFAVTGRNPTKAVIEEEYLVVTPDSTRIWVNQNETKARVGGFAVTGRNPTKGVTGDLLVINEDSARIYIKDTITTKARVGGFAVTGRNPTKGLTNNIFVTNSGNTQVYIKDTVAGFGVNNLQTGAAENLMNLNKQNYYIGHNAGASNIDGVYNLYFGYNAGKNITTGNSNTFIGYESGASGSGEDNVAVGRNSMYSAGGNHNVAIGYNALYDNSGNDNVAIGNNSMYSARSGGENVAIGNNAMYYLDDGNSNVGIGDYALEDNKYGHGNVAIGENAMRNGEDISDNVAVGRRSLQSLTTGESNVSIGSSAGYKNTEGTYNVFLGGTAAYDNRTGSNNVSIGYKSAYENETGGNNVFIGTWAGENLTGGDGNVFIGYNARCTSNMSISNSMAIGNDATVNTSNKIAIGNSSVTWIGGQVTWSTYSDKRLKKDIVYTDRLGLNLITKLNTASYSFKDDINGKRYDGLIAQDVQKVLSELGIDFSALRIDDDKDKTLSLSYSEFVIPLINSVKELNSKLEKVEKENEELKQKLNEIIELLKNQ